MIPYSVLALLQREAQSTVEIQNEWKYSSFVVDA